MSKTTLADIIGTCERAAFRMGLDHCEPPTVGPAGDGLVSIAGDDSASDRPAAYQAGRESAGANQIWTTSQDAALLAMFNGGMSVDDMGNVIDVPLVEIRQRLLWLALPKPHMRSA